MKRIFGTFYTLKNFKVTKASILLITALAFENSCNLFDRHDPKPKTELEKLPPLTTEGKNTFGCLVNGNALNVTNPYYVNAIYQGGGIAIYGVLNGKTFNQSVGMMVLDPFEENIDYSLTDLPNSMASFGNTIGETTCWYEFPDTFSGKIHFTEIDRVKYIASGTFEFSIATSGCDTIRVTKGRFDIQYTP